VPKEAIAGVVVTTQRGTTVSLGADGQPLRPSMIWLDQRRAELAPRLPWWWEAAFAAIGTRVNAIVRGKAVPMEVRAMPFVPANYYRG